MKRAVLLHGTDGTPDNNWFPWLKDKLETEGYQVWAPALWDAHTPNRETWDSQILGGRDLSDTIVVGHSSGAVEVLNLLMNPRCPRIRLGVMVSAWAGGPPVPADGIEWDKGQFDNLFPLDGFNFDMIKSNADKLAFLHSDDDPYCPLEQAEYLAEELNAPLTVVHEGHHLGAKFNIEFPELWEIIKPSL